MAWYCHPCHFTHSELFPHPSWKYWGHQHSLRTLYCKGTVTCLHRYIAPPPVPKRAIWYVIGILDILVLSSMPFHFPVRGSDRIWYYLHTYTTQYYGLRRNYNKKYPNQAKKRPSHARSSRILPLPPQHRCSNITVIITKIDHRSYLPSLPVCRDHWSS